MTEIESSPAPPQTDDTSPPTIRNPLRVHPTLQIWLIAGVFYLILIGMFLFVLVLIIRG